jgi:tetratricopeptide (TPR) repeat protein
LCHIAGLKVISRTSTRQYQSKPDNLREIAKELGVANILEGSVQKVADQVRVNVQLVNARTDSNLWADSYDRKLTDIFAVQSQIAREIADALRVNLTIREKETLAKRPTNILEAYDAYLRGLALEARYYSSYSADIVRKVGDFYEQAVRLDPDFAVAWARLSRSDALLYFNRDDQNPQFRRDTAKRALENAQRLEPDSPETLLALGYYQYWVLRDYSLAKTTFLRVIKVWPSSSEVLHALARVTRREGHWKESMEYSQQALILDPRNTELITHLAWTEAMLRQFIPALELCDRALDIAPYDPDMDALKARIYQAQGNLQQAARFLSGVTELSPNDDTFMVKMTQLRLERNYHECTRLLETRLAQFHFSSPDEKGRDQTTLALTRWLSGDTAGAKAAAEQARNTLAELPADALILVSLSQTYVALAEKEKAQNEAERAITLLPNAKDAVKGPSSKENLAFICSVFGEQARAISILTELLQTPYSSWLYAPTPITPALLRIDPLWDGLRGDPAFQKLCAEKQP